MKWSPVKGYEDKYEVSDAGDIRSSSGRLLGQWENDQGYRLVRFSKPRAVIRAHRVVAEAFIANPENLPFVNHLDCNRSNNCVSNLEWCTQWQNLNHSDKLGRMKRNYWLGKRSPNAALTDEIVSAIRREYASGRASWEALGRKHNISKRTIGRIITGVSYVHKMA